MLKNLCVKKQEKKVMEPPEPMLRSLSPLLQEALRQSNYTKFYSGSVFSNFHYAPFKLHGWKFFCTEQCYMFKKAQYFGDSHRAWEIMQTTNPYVVKQLGSRIRGFNAAQWDKVCRQVMHDANRAKYETHRHLRHQLFTTAGTILVECSPTDKRWGIGCAMDHSASNHWRNWHGANWLGFILTNLREDLAHDPRFCHEESTLRSGYLCPAGLPSLNSGSSSSSGGLKFSFRTSTPTNEEEPMDWEGVDEIDSPCPVLFP